MESVSRFTDRITRLFLQTPPTVREAVYFFFRGMLKLPPVRRKILRRMTMIGLDYPASPLLEPAERAAGVRVPDVKLIAPDGTGVRLYDLLPPAPVMLDVAEQRAFSADLPMDEAIRVGPGAYRDPTGLLHGLLGGRDGWSLVRPDAHVAWARQRLGDVNEPVRHGLGISLGRLQRCQTTGGSRP